jgi:SAM-dependent methyltransferase
MTPTTDESARYGAYYFRTYRGAPYERSPKWLLVFGAMADGIVREIAPRRVLDVGCAMGFLVESLRDRGVEADGLDVSETAIAAVRDDIRPFCHTGSIVDPVAGRYDLVVCSEVLEHLPSEQAEPAVAHLCAAADDVLFSSTPDGYAEDTHLNVQPPEYWAGLFARHGFVHDLEFDASAFLAPWAVRFRRSAEPLHRVLSGYERRLWALSQEVRALRARGLETMARLERQDQALRARADVAALEQQNAEQQEHLDALNDRLLYMSDHEAELRRMLLDAHRQLVERDAMLQGHPPADSAAALQALVDERTAWAQRAVEELEACRQVAIERQALIDERTAWAQRAVAELDAYRRTRMPLLFALRRRLLGR